MSLMLKCVAAMLLSLSAYVESHAAVNGWSYAGVCYPSTQAAVDAFINNFDVRDSVAEVWLTSRNAAPAAAINVNFTYSFSYTRKVWGGLSSSGTDSRVFQPCDTAWISQSNHVLTIALVFSTLMGFGQGFKSSFI